jgi:hypothetical protein
MLDLKEKHVFVDRDSLRLTAKIDDVSVRDSLMEISKKYIELLPHIPYKFVDLNFLWFVEFEKKEVIPDTNFTIGNCNLPSIIKSKHDLNFGGTIYVCESIYHLKLNIQPGDERIIQHFFNYSFDIEKKTRKAINGYINRFNELYNSSKEIVQKIYGMEK